MGIHDASSIVITLSWTKLVMLWFYSWFYSFFFFRTCESIYIFFSEGSCTFKYVKNVHIWHTRPYFVYVPFAFIIPIFYTWFQFRYTLFFMFKLIPIFLFHQILSIYVQCWSMFLFIFRFRHAPSSKFSLGFEMIVKYAP